MALDDKFDPYHRWLSIPPAEQPPTLYRLLGLSPFEEDVEVIHAAADRQMAYLRSLGSGQHATAAQELLNEISSARLTLTGEGKANYDAVLRGAAPADAENEVSEKPSPPTDKPLPQAKPVATKPTDEPLPLNVDFGPFRLLELSKQSPLGDVYKASHPESGRIVSLKVLPPGSTRNREVTKRFERERQIVTQLSHPNLISGLEGGEINGQPWLAMEYVTGMDLASLVKQQGPLPVSQAVDFIAQAARGLMQLHMRDVIHRNVKPQVLWVDVQGQVKVTNLFLAKLGEGADVVAADEDLTVQGQQMGTATYLSPEQAMDAKAADHRSDIYSLGCTLHFLLTGQPPFVSKNMMKILAAHQTTPAPSLKAQRNDVTDEVEAAYQKMLAKSHDARFQTMGDVVDQLQKKPKQSFWGKLFGLSD